MVSASKAKRDAKRAEKKSKDNSTASSVNGDAADAAAEAIAKMTMQVDKHGLSDRVTTGVLASMATSRDIKVSGKNWRYFVLL